MKADIQLSDTFPHGTPDGFTAGCRGSHCPAVIACRKVYRRYAGDWEFRRKIDAGVSLSEILAQDAAKAAEQAVYVAQAAERRRQAPKGRPNRTNASDALRDVWDAKALIPRAVLHALVADGLTDREIAEKFGLKRHQVANSRISLGLKCNPAKRKSILDDLPALAHLSDAEAAERLSKNIDYVRQMRRKLARATAA